MELFSTPSSVNGNSTPLAAKMAPQDWGEFVGQDHLVSKESLLRRMIDNDRLTSSIFFGPPGTGKTALARLAARKTNSVIEYLNAVTTGVADIRLVMKKAHERKKMSAQRTLLVVDEIHHFNRTQQDALLPDVERGNLILVGMTTENPFFYVNSALISRTTVYEFKPLVSRDLTTLLSRVLTDLPRHYAIEKIELSSEAQEHLIRQADGDARRLLNSLELAFLVLLSSGEKVIHVDLKTAENSVQKRALRYDKKGDDHYDIISAFIKSMRGSDPDAALYWMAKMLVAGEDPRFIARRMVVFASEDIGNADPMAMMVAQSAAQSAHMLGMPEARLPLAQAATYLACAPKSNASYQAIDSALSEVKNGPQREVPAHLKDGNLDANTLGHGKGYQYPHSFPGHFIEQVYMPDAKIFYQPENIGLEEEISKRLKYWRDRKTNLP